MHGACILYLPPNLPFQVLMLIEHPCTQVGLPVDYTEGYDPKLA